MGRKPTLRPDERPVQLSVSFPRPLYDFIVEESQKLGINRTELVKQCVVAYAIKGDTKFSKQMSVALKNALNSLYGLSGANKNTK